MNYQNLFNRDFYPTPKSVIDIMMQGEDVTDRIILEPSAGSGCTTGKHEELPGEVIYECHGVHHLHQLQNAYYMATEEELEVQP